MAAPIINSVRLFELLKLDPDTGIFRWRARTSNLSRIKIGDVAGCEHPDGYIYIQVDDRKYTAHRLAWRYVTGKWPAKHIDHRDGNPSNNRFDNLREATHAENMQNQRKAQSNNKSSGLLGATWNKQNGKWKAQIGFDGKKRYLGYFTTAEQAHAAYLAEKKKVHPFSTI